MQFLFVVASNAFVICFLTYNGELEKVAGGDFGALHPLMYMPLHNAAGEPVRPKGDCPEPIARIDSDVRDVLGFLQEAVQID